MSTATCPTCGADIETDLIASTGDTDCPFCGADVSEMLTESSTETTSTDHEAGRDSYFDPRDRPSDGRVEVVEANDDRVVLFIPGGSKRARGAGCFAFFWLLITGTVTGGFLSAGLFGQGAGNFPLYFAIPFFAIFWMVGLGMIYWWLVLKYQRTTILLTKETAAVQKVLFNRRRVTEIAIDPTVKSRLVEVYQENETPVYAVAVDSGGDTLKFGLGLSDDEKHWVRRDINRFYGKGDSPKKPQVPKVCPECDATLEQVLIDTESGTYTCPSCSASITGRLTSKKVAGDPLPPLTPEELPSGSEVEIEEDGERFVFSYPAFKKTGTMRKISGFLLIPMILMELFVIGFFITFMLNVNAPIFVLIPFAIFVVVSSSMGIMVVNGIRKGRIRIGIGPEETTARIGYGFLGYTHKLNNRSIEEIVCGRWSNLQGSYNVSTTGRNNMLSGSSAGCMLRTHGKPIPITSNHDRETVIEVGGLMLGRLLKLGFQPVGRQLWS